MKLVYVGLETTFQNQRFGFTQITPQVLLLFNLIDKPFIHLINTAHIVLSSMHIVITPMGEFPITPD